MLEQFPPKPEGMHQKQYEQLRSRHHAATHAAGSLLRPATRRGRPKRGFSRTGTARLSHRARKSVRRRAIVHVQRRETPAQRVAKNHHVRRQFRRPRGFPLDQNFVRCLPKQGDRVLQLRFFHAVSVGLRQHRQLGCKPTLFSDGRSSRVFVRVAPVRHLS
jgi:hypothetical protein